LLIRRASSGTRPRQLQTNIVLPVDVNRTVVRFQWHSYQPLPNPEADARWNELAWSSEEAQAEDAHICEAVQLNIGSRAYQSGPYSPQRESGVRLFHPLLCHS
jgi:phenylpropionate dioxygenase-like ring-hydroxylating dioxygenase large terminal subunit